MNSTLFRVAVVALAAWGLAGCATTPVPIARSGAPTLPDPVPATGLVAVAPEQGLDPALLKPGTDIFRLGPGDKLEIEVIGDSSTRATVTVGPDGKIYYYLLPGIDVWGLTLSETRSRLVGGLQQYLREKPTVAVSLNSVASQHVWVLGQVSAPGVYTIAGPTTLLDAIAQGGGLSAANTTGAQSAGIAAVPVVTGGLESADLSRAFVIRRGQRLSVNFQKLLQDGDLSQNIYLQPDDFVYLPPRRTSEIFVLGAVARPQAQKMSGSLTLAQAVAMSGGTAPDAFASNVAILRGSLAEPQIALVDLAAIVHGRAPDVRLEPGDIVYVPSKPYRTLERYADLILDTFARTLGVNAGAHAAGGNVSPVGVNVSLGH